MSSFTNKESLTVIMKSLKYYESAGKGIYLFYSSKKKFLVMLSFLTSIFSIEFILNKIIFACLVFELQFTEKIIQKSNDIKVLIF